MKNTAWTMLGTAAVLGLMAAGAGAQSISLGNGSYRMMYGAAAQAGDAGAKDDLFAGTEVFAKNASDVNEITMDPDTLDLVKGKDGKRAHNMILNVVRSYTFDKPGMYNMADVDAIRAKLNTGDWHCSVHTRDLKTGESTDICQKRRTDDLRETAIITVEPKELTFIHTITRRSSDDTSEVGGLPLVIGPGSFTSLAVLNPEAFVEMHEAMARMQSTNFVQMQQDLGEAMKQHALYFKQNVEHFKKLQRDPMDTKQIDELKNSPDGLRIIPEVPATPEVPAVPAVPESPKP